jgi:hypothetical protein
VRGSSGQVNMTYYILCSIGASIMTLILYCMCRFPTSLNDDKDKLLPLLEKNTKLGPEEYALILVKGEKEVLTFFEDFATCAVALLETTSEQAFHSLLQRYKTSFPDFIYHYFAIFLPSLMAKKWEYDDNSNTLNASVNSDTDFNTLDGVPSDRGYLFASEFETMYDACDDNDQKDDMQQEGCSKVLVMLWGRKKKE